MKLRATSTQYLDVDVSTRDVYEAFLSHYASRAFPDQNHRPLHPSNRDHQYINKEGFWEHWEDGHGSGYTTTKRKATKEEVKAMEFYDNLRELRNMF